MGVSIVSYLLISVQATISTADPMVTNTKRSRMVTMANGHTFLLLLLLLFPGESTENYHTSSIQRCISKLVVVGEVVGEVVGHWDIIITFRNEYNHSVDDNITYDLEKLLSKNYPLKVSWGYGVPRVSRPFGHAILSRNQHHYTKCIVRSSSDFLTYAKLICT